MKIEERKADGTAVRRGRPAFGWAWELWCLGALWLVCIGVAVWSLTAGDTAANRLYGDTAFQLSFYPALALSPFLVGRYRVRRRRHTVAVAEEPADDDARKSVLYLRSFRADETAARRTGLSTEEEELEEALREIGQFTAVGEPGEELPDVGAARFYVEDERWEEVVKSLMPKARLVVMRVGDSDGFWKEMGWAAELVEPRRLVLLLPGDKGVYEAFRRKAEGILPRPLPEYGFGRARLGSLNGVLYFGPDWTPRRADFVTLLLRGTARHSESYKLKYALRPVYEQLGVKWTRPRLGGITPTLVLIGVALLLGGGYALFIRGC